MESLGAGFQWLPPASGNVLDMVTPATYGDAAALAVIAAASAAYSLRKYTWDRPDPYDYIWYERPQANDAKGGAARTTRNIAERLEELVRPSSMTTMLPATKSSIPEPASGHLLGFSVRYL